MPHLEFIAGKAYLCSDSKDAEDIAVDFSIRLLGHRITVFDEMTFGQFWNWLTADPLLVDLLSEVFHAPMFGHPLKHYVEVGKTAPTCADPIEDKPGIMQSLNVGWNVDAWEGDLELHPDFGGWGRWDADVNGGEFGAYGVSYTAISNLMRYPFFLKTEVEIVPLPANHDVPEPYKPVFVSKREFTLYDVILAIVDEITWGGLDAGASVIGQAHEAVDELRNQG